MKTEYITVRLTAKEAEALLTMARSGDYQNEEEGCPHIRLPSNRAEKKIQRALAKLRAGSLKREGSEGRLR